jgi:hypothetical protein
MAIGGTARGRRTMTAGVECKRWGGVDGQKGGSEVSIKRVWGAL